MLLSEDDCGTDRGLLIRAITDGKEVRKHLKNVFKVVTLRNQLRILQQGEVIVGPDTLITEDMAAGHVNAGKVEEVTIRSVPYM